MKKCVNTMVASTIVFFPGGFVNTIATAAPSGFTLPAQGLHLNVQPPINSHHLNAHPVIPHPAGHVQLLIPHTYTYIATTKSKARKQGAVSTGSVHWTCKGNRCTTRTAWARPTVQTCKTLARSVGPIQSYGKRGAMLNATDMRSCNAGIMVAKSKRKRKSNTPFNFNSNLAIKAPMVRPRTFARPPVRGGFAPSPGNRRVLSASPPAGGGFAPAIKIAPAIRNHGNTPANLLSHRSGGGFAPDTVRTSQLVLVGKPQVPDTVSTERLVLVGKPQAPDTVRTSQLVLVGKPQVPDTVRTGQLVLVGKPQVPDTVRTGQLILVGKRH